MRLPIQRQSLPLAYSYLALVWSVIPCLTQLRWATKQPYRGDSDSEDEVSGRIQGGESDDGEMLIQVEDHYGDPFGDGFVLETEERPSSSTYPSRCTPSFYTAQASLTFICLSRKSSEFVHGKQDKDLEQMEACSQETNYRLIQARELRLQRQPIGRGVFGVVYSAGIVPRPKLPHLLRT